LWSFVAKTAFIHDLPDRYRNKLNRIVDRLRARGIYGFCFSLDFVNSAAKPRRSYTLDRRRSMRCGKLHKRLEKRWSFPSMRRQEAIDTVLSNPWRYGICPLPPEGSCNVSIGDQLVERRRKLALETEAELARGNFKKAERLKQRQKEVFT